MQWFFSEKLKEKKEGGNLNIIYKKTIPHFLYKDSFR